MNHHARLGPRYWYTVSWCTIVLSIIYIIIINFIYIHIYIYTYSTCARHCTAYYSVILRSWCTTSRRCVLHRNHALLSIHPLCFCGCCQRWWHPINTTTRTWQMLHETIETLQNWEICYSRSVSQQSLPEMATMSQVTFTSNELK